MGFILEKIFNKLFARNNNDELICNKGKSKKLFFTGNEELMISSSNDKKADEVTKLAYTMLQKYKDKPEAILQFMESKGTKIVLVPQLLPLLKFLGYEEGFIPKHCSWKAFVLNFAIQTCLKETHNLSFEMPDVLITCKKDINVHFIAYHFHHWLSYINELPGYNAKTLSLFRATFNNPKANMNLLSINQILSLKDIIDRDRQAIDFVQKFVREQVGAKKCVDNMISGQTVNI